MTLGPLIKARLLPGIKVFAGFFDVTMRHSTFGAARPEDRGWRCHLGGGEPRGFLLTGCSSVCVAWQGDTRNSGGHDGV